MPQFGMAMELKGSSLKPSGLSPPESMSDPDEKEVSDDDDDDRNHKHRRRDTRSQSFERDPLDQPLSQPYRKRNRTFENGQNDSQSHFNFERDSSKFDKRRVNFSRFPNEPGSGRGRGRNFQRDSRFGNIDVTPQMGHPGSVQPGLFPGRGLPNVSNPQCGPWNGFGILPGIPNGGIDAINPLGMSGILRPQLNSSLNMGIQRQRCRDFEERGFCLRGDMCPMEHGVHRIVVDDVQSLSQFNLPASLSNPHVLATSAGSGFMPAGASQGTLLNSRALHSRTNKSIMDEESLIGPPNPSGADVYDPDQPLWNNNGHDMSEPLLGLQPLPFDESDPFVEPDLSERFMLNSGVSNGSQSTSSSVWGRLNSKNKSEPKEKFDAKSIEIHEPSNATQGTSHLGKSNNGGTYNTKVVGSTSKVQNVEGDNPRKPSQKAQRTLFVNHIPLKDNKRENLLSHFRKFGEVIDIYIPTNSERAFVQFSKREEAERALQAPDAVMGSRFIKLWWANRDSVLDGNTNSSNNVITSQGGPPVLGSSNMTTKKENIQCVATKVGVPKPSEGIITVGNDLKPSVVNSPKAPPPAPKKMENLEILKELRKKQEMLEQKRNEFRRQLDKLAKHATGVKGEVPVVQTSKKQKVETLSIDVSKDTNTKSGDSIPPFQADILGETTVNTDNLTSQRSKTSTGGSIRDHPNLKLPVRVMGSSATTFPMNRYKLDNRPTTFRINAPLPLGLANVVAIKEHFSTFGVVSDVEVEDSGEESSPKTQKDPKSMKNCSARVSFVTRISAEKAFVNGKSWHGHILQFSWLPSNIPTTSRSSGESSSTLKGTVPNPEVQSQDKTQVDKSESPSKSSNELSGEIQRNSYIESQLSDQLTNYIPLEEDDQEIRDTELQEEEDRAMDDEDSRGSPDFADEERVA